MKYLHLFAFPVLLMLYGFLSKFTRAQYYDIEGAIITILVVLGSIITIVLWSLLKEKVWMQTWYARILLGVAGCVIAYFLLLIYVQFQNMPWYQKQNATPAIREQ